MNINLPDNMEKIWGKFSKEEQVLITKIAAEMDLYFQHAKEQESAAASQDRIASTKLAAGKVD